MSDTADIMEAIGTPANIEFMVPTASRPTDSTGYDANNVFLTGDGISKVDVVVDPSDATNYVIKLTFTDEGTKNSVTR